jgi:RNA polymerase sigma-70 factor (ECF subfamily)
MTLMPVEAALVVADHRTDELTSRVGELFDVHHQRLYRLARRMSRDVEDARDILQETFLRAARTPRSIPSGAANEEAWLVRVLINLCRDRWRQTATRRRLDETADRTLTLTTPDQESALIARSIVWNALSTLSPRRRAVIVMYELEGSTIQSIARTLGVTSTTVRWHLSVGRREMTRTIGTRGTLR